MRAPPEVLEGWYGHHSGISYYHLAQARIDMTAEIAAY
jgi:hypothetical protein